MKNFITPFVALCVLIGLEACTQMKPEIVEFDPSYKAKKPEAIDRSKLKLPPVDLVNKYVYFKDNDKVATAVVTVKNGQRIANPIAEANVTIVATNITEPIVVSVVEMTKDNHPKTFADIVKGETILLPQDAYTLSGKEVSFNALEKEQNLSISFNAEKIKTLNKTYQYVIPLVVQLPEGKELKEHNYFLLTLKIVEGEAIPEGNNVRLTDSTPNFSDLLEGDQITFDASSAKDHLYKMKDGNTNGQNWWVKSGKADEFLDIKFPKQAISGIEIYTHSSENKELKKVDVSVSIDDGKTFIKQGTVETTQRNGDSMIIEFIKPVNVSQIRLNNFEGFQDWINFYEVQVYYLEEEDESSLE